MSSSAKSKYMAFISYRHSDNKEQDRQWATWLHQQIEIYDIPHELIGTTNQYDEIIPESIYPVFRDEESLAAEAELSRAIYEALDQTNHLVVLCSPNAVESIYVGEEIRYYKHLGRASEISSAIISGQPWAVQSEYETPCDCTDTGECFPAALRYVIDAEGQLDTTQKADPLAADFRLPTGGRGFTNPSSYKTYLISNGHSETDAEILRSKYEEQINNARLKIIARVLGVPLEDLTRRDKSYQLRKAQADARKARRNSAIFISLLVIALIGAVVAWSQYSRANDVLQTLRGSLKFLVYDLDSTLEAYVPIDKQEHVKSQVDTIVETLKEYGGDIHDDRRNRAVALSDEADLLLQGGGSLENAKSIILQAQSMFRELLTDEPDNIAWQQNLAVSYSKLGSIYQAQGRLDQSLSAFEKSLIIRRRLASGEPTNSRWQVDLSLSYDDIGVVFLAQGMPHRALQSFRSSFEINKRLASFDPTNSQWQIDLAGSYQYLGETYRAQNQMQSALEAFTFTAEIMRALLLNDPHNRVWLRDFSLAQNKIGGIHQYLGAHDLALSAFQSTHDILVRLTQDDPNNIHWQRDMSISLEKIGSIHLASGKTDQAIKAFTRSAKIAESLVNIDPSNSQWQYDLMVAYTIVSSAYATPQEQLTWLNKASKIGDYLRERGQLFGPRKQWANKIENLIKQAKSGL